MCVYVFPRIWLCTGHGSPLKTRLKPNYWFYHFAFGCLRVYNGRVLFLSAAESTNTSKCNLIHHHPRYRDMKRAAVVYGFRSMAIHSLHAVVFKETKTNGWESRGWNEWAYGSTNNNNNSKKGRTIKLGSGVRYVSVVAGGVFFFIEGTVGFIWTILFWVIMFCSFWASGKSWVMINHEGYVVDYPKADFSSILGKIDEIFLWLWKSFCEHEELKGSVLNFK